MHFLFTVDQLIQYFTQFSLEMSCQQVSKTYNFHHVFQKKIYYAKDPKFYCVTIRD